MTRLEELLKEFEIEFDSEKNNKLQKYKEILLEWNSFMNLTAITDDEEIDVKHFLDCLTIFKTGELDGKKSVIDVGTGAGFPGIPMAIKNPDLEVTLLDSLNKRIKFLNKVVEETDLKNVTTYHGRAEEFARKKEFRDSFDVSVSRAVANMATLTEYTLPYVKPGGVMIAMKGSEYKEELKEAENAIKVLGGEIKNVMEITLPDGILHSLIVVEKVKPTPKKYPRSGGKPKSKPL
ncbi:16S rRNA (guanine(527)-N(7))-methyltransferase RsmG [Peptoniphilus duerdenii]|uniref:16S rRNA (guanine(527)-N(7))-methyltransferase RsmG n=1 Tax=Peptoniphilus duerdenii TaxID=507750 RepID=UPI00288C5F62|nr:16S rRNA (guanine(527)-N(7))-methyltransferase RsmG [Peptoniphilus duerdenii]